MNRYPSSSFFPALFDHHIPPVFWPAFLLSLVGIVGGARIADRIARGKPTSPGEMLWLVVGTGQLVYLLVFVSCYEYRIPPPYLNAGEQLAFWFLPRLAATLSLLVPLRCYRSFPEWRLLFFVAIGVQALVSMDGCCWQQTRFAEESLVVLSGVFWLGGIVVWAIVLSLQGPYPGYPQRRLAHWTGLLLALLPAVGFVVGWNLGWVDPQEVFLLQRVLK